MSQETSRKDLAELPLASIDEPAVNQSAGGTVAKALADDDYGRWLYEHTGTIDQALDLEF